ncbi:MAG TPA: hypothetical protein VET85_00380, partial [Stellaceae bacterium]|nr:hypothetical protein [Stellaceae bacterium]
NDERANPNTTSPFSSLFYIKGAASAEQFRSRIRGAARSGIAVPVPTLPSLSLPRPRPRLWMRVDGEYRARVKRAASARGQTCQAFLADALSMRLSGFDMPGAEPSLDFAEVAAPRVKLSIAVDNERRRQAHEAAARLGTTVQSYLCDTIDRHLARAALPIAALN